MENNLGHLDPHFETARRLSEANRSLVKEDGRLTREFSRTLGDRTFRLIERIGLARQTTFISGLDPSPFGTVRSSEPLQFTLPGNTNPYSLRFELVHSPQHWRLPGNPPSRISVTSAELTQSDANQTRKSYVYVSDSQYVNSIAVNNSSLGYSRRAMPEYANNVARFSQILGFAETILAGQMPEYTPEEAVVFTGLIRQIEQGGNDNQLSIEN